MPWVRFIQVEVFLRQLSSHELKGLTAKKAKTAVKSAKLSWLDVGQDVELGMMNDIKENSS